MRDFVGCGPLAGEVAGCPLSALEEGRGRGLLVRGVLLFPEQRTQELVEPKAVLPSRASE